VKETPYERKESSKAKNYWTTSKNAAMSSILPSNTSLRKKLLQFNRWQKITNQIITQLINSIMTHPISSREHQVLYLVAHERTANEIADELFISNHTVISHRKNLMEKVLHLIAHEHTAKEIAQKLYISNHTAISHR
jgi:DNA-binding CsgD family transcriptional regulator